MLIQALVFAEVDELTRPKTPQKTSELVCHPLPKVEDKTEDAPLMSKVYPEITRLGDPILIRTLSVEILSAA
jgi:hypothetical protein